MHPVIGLRANCAMTATTVAPPLALAGARALVLRWHPAECWVAAVAFACIAMVLPIDEIGRELLAPLLRMMDFKVGALGIQGSQKLALYALVIVSYAGVGIATATGSHLVPRVACSQAAVLPFILILLSVLAIVV